MSNNHYAPFRYQNIMGTKSILLTILVHSFYVEIPTTFLQYLQCLIFRNAIRVIVQIIAVTMLYAIPLIKSEVTMNIATP